MKITRMDQNKNLETRVGRIEFECDKIRYAITEDPQKGFRIHRSDGDYISIQPAVRNEIIVF